MKNKLIGLLFLIFMGQNIYADLWSNPQIEHYYSENKVYILKVFPTDIPKNYFKWMSSSPKKKERFTAKDTMIIFCHVILYKIDDMDTVRIWERKLINEIAPAHVIVANDGKSIITFDNWSSNGYGVNVMVSYDECGKLVKRYSLEDISPFPINDYLITMSSIHWRSEEKYIDKQRVEIIFSDKVGNNKIRIYNIEAQEFE
jgi:hypothetical protein